MPEKIAPLENPFPGLRAFEASETHLFFGRDGQCDELVRLLARNRFLAVVGTSGSGKSSLVRAGMLTALRSGLMADAGSSWRIAIMRPGSAPITNLAIALNDPAVLGRDELDAETRQMLLETTLRRGGFGLIQATRQAWMAEHENLFVLVDQFEEIFRLRAIGRDAVGSGGEAGAFVKLLLEATRQTELPVYVAITMRSDFLGDCAEFPDLPAALNRSQYLIPRLTRDQRCEAIEGPIAVNGGTITRRLVQRLLNDVGDDPDQLPILQHALMRTWEAWQTEGDPATPLDLQHYESIGGMATALSRHADEAYEELSDRGKTVARRVFQCLTERGLDSRETRRPTRLSEICKVAEATSDEVIEVVDKFRSSGRTFLTPPAGETLVPTSVIDISHESLVRIWGRLHTWVDEEAQSAAFYRRLADDAARHKAGHAALWRDPNLELAIEWRDRSAPNQAWAERYDPGYGVAIEFLEASRRQRTLARGIRSATVALLVALTLVSAYSAIRASRSAREAFARQLAAQSAQAQSDGHFEVGALLGVESMRLLPLFEGDSALRSGIQQLPIPIHVWTSGAEVLAVAFSANGKYVAAGTSKGTAELFEAATGRELAKIDHAGPVNAVAFSPNGALLATASSDHTARVIDTGTGRVSLQLALGDQVNAVAFSPDAKYLAAASSDATVRVFDLGNGKEVASLLHGAAVNAIAYSPDGKYVATASDDKTARVLEIKDNRQIVRVDHDGPVNDVAISGDSRYVVTGSSDGTLREIEVATNKQIWTFKQPEGTSASIAAVAFSIDGKYVASGSSDHVARVYEVETGREVAHLEHEGPVTDVAFSPDEQYLATASADAKARVFEIAKGREVSRLVQGATVKAVAFSGDGRYIVTGSTDHTTRMFAVTTGSEIFQTPKGVNVWAAGLSPDGRYLALGSSDNVARVLDAQSGREMRHWTHDAPVAAVAFSGDGNYLATGSSDNTARVFEISSGREIRRLSPGKAVVAIAFSPDEKNLATGSMSDVTATIWDIGSGRETSRLVQSATLRALAFNPDGRSVATGSTDHIVRVFDSTTGHQLARLSTDDTILALAFSPDGKYVVAACQDRTVWMFDWKTGSEIWHQGVGERLVTLVFSRDGRLVGGGGPHGVEILDANDGARQSSIPQEFGVLALDFDKSAASVEIVSGDSRIVIDYSTLSPSVLISDACARLASNLTRAEWSRYLGTMPYRKTCPNLPEAPANLTSDAGHK